MSFDEAILKCLAKYSVLTGRARPSEFWWFMLLYFATALLAAIAVAAAPGLARLLVLALAGLSVPAFAVTVRRLHDIGAGGWMLVFLVPVLGQALLLFWLTRPSVPRLNRFGPEPDKQRPRTLLFAR